MIDKIEKGKQMGFSIRILKNDKYYWYSYAVQKYKLIYYVYEVEYEENISVEENEYEKIEKYSTFDEVKKYFPGRYETKFEDVSILKGEKIFNINFYI